MDITIVDWNYYYLTGAKMTSGWEEPDWHIEIGDTVNNNELIWETVNEFDGTVLSFWEPNHQYSR